MKTVDICGVKRRRAALSAKGLIALFLFLPLLARAAFAVDLNQPVTVDIAAGTPLVQALLELFLKADVKYSAPSVAGYQAPALHATLPLGEALARLLQGTGLSFAPKGDTLWVFKAAPGASVDQVDPEGTGSIRGGDDTVTETRSRKSPANTEDRDMSEVRVRGVHIPDAALTKPDMSFDSSALERAGFRTVGDFLRSLPQSFGGGLNLGVISAGGSQNTTSQSAASTANLRGLGSASTLTLVNGQRVAAAEGSGAVDVTLIPLSAVDRIEIITSGASAAYGSDAVAGVVNIILKSDYQGAELSGTVGGATEGGGFLHGYSVVVGHSWQATNLFATHDCAWQQPIDSSQRSYVPTDIAGTTLLPGLHRCSTLLGGSQDLPHDAQLRVVGVYTQRSVSQAENLDALSPGLAAATQANVDQYVLNTNTTVPLSRNWTGALYTSVSADKIVSPELLTLNATPYKREGDRFNDQLRSLEVGAAGTVRQLGWWNPKLALGAGGSVDDFLSASLPAGLFLITKQRRSQFGFAETAMPLLPGAAAPSRSPVLALDVAVRTQHYSDVGTTTNPKVTLSYTPTSSFALAASWGTSFRAPSLLQEYNISQATLKLIPDPSAVGGRSLGLFRFGGNSDLQPEEASQSTVYLTFAPSRLPDLLLQLDYYDIFYTKRIEFPTSNTGNPLCGSERFAVREPQSECCADRANFDRVPTGGPDWRAIYCAGGLDSRR